MIQNLMKKIVIIISACLLLGFWAYAGPNLEQSDLVFEATVKKTIIIGGGSRFKAQAREEVADLNWLAVLDIRQISKGKYSYNTLGLLMHSPVLTFGSIHPSVERKYKFYLKRAPTKFTDYALIGCELVRD